MRANQAWKAQADGIDVAVRVTPRASKDALLAGTDEHFAARLAAPPVDGAANAALIALLAKQFDVAKRAIAFKSGENARLKRLHICGSVTKLEGIARTLYGDAHDS